ncbi:MAG TPA: DUF4153 domain-containing protein [Bacteroidota bacterium]|nr:DUF4153 domain-containing protein [Bacteroidota bacterium]
MKLPSLSYLAEHSVRTFRRFPLALADAVAGTIASLVLINREGLQGETFLTNTMLTTALGIAFLTTITVVGEKRKWNGATKFASQLAGVIALIGYYFTLPADLEAAPSLHMIRFAMFAVTIHLLTAAAPFAGLNEPNGFWQYNKAVFMRILNALLYSGVLFAGLAIALEALEQLFGVDISFKRYGQLWAAIMGIFNTWFFLAGMPDDLDKLNLETEYPRGLQIFTQYILIPLVVIYFFILYAYMGKIIIEQQWPKGWVTGLIFGFSITGILALLLIHPIKDRIENVWIRTFSKWYYALLLPLDILLLLAIWRRISDYGITASRYIVAVLGLWLTAISLYFVISRVKNIKVIPTSLCVIGFLSAFGPWGAFSISLRSQLHRLEPLLSKNGILFEGKIRKTNGQVSFDDSKEISAIVRYLIETHGTETLQPLFADNLDTLGKRQADSLHLNARYQLPQVLVAMMGIGYVNQWQSVKSQSFSYSSPEDRVLNIEGFDKLLRLHISQPRDTIAVTLDHDISCVVVADQGKLLAQIVASGGVEDTVRLDFRPMMKQLRKINGTVANQSNIAAESMTVRSEGNHLRATIFVYDIQGKGGQDTLSAFSMRADLLIGLKSK